MSIHTSRGAATPTISTLTITNNYVITTSTTGPGAKSTTSGNTTMFTESVTIKKGK